MRQVGLNKGIGNFHSNNLMPFCSINDSSKGDGFQNGRWDKSRYIEFSQQGCLDMGIMVKRMKLRCTPVFFKQQVQMVQGLSGIRKFQLGKILKGYSGGIVWLRLKEKWGSSLAAISNDGLNRRR